MTKLRGHTSVNVNVDYLEDTVCINIFDLHVKHELGTSIRSTESAIASVPSKIIEEITPEEKEEMDNVHKYFVQLAGDDEEVDWIELKNILDFSMQTELRQSNGNKTASKRKVTGVNATPSATAPQIAQTQAAGDTNGLLYNLLSMICGTLCKDTPLAEVIPAPVQSTALNTSLSEIGLEGFSKDICRSMVAMLDEDRSGRLGVSEFKKLWALIRTWKNVWLLYDTDKSGTFSGFELREALNSAGYSTNIRILNILMHRYGTKKGEIHFEDFMMCAIKLKTMLDLFKEKDQSGLNLACFSMEEWLEFTLYS